MNESVYYFYRRFDPQWFIGVIKQEIDVTRIGNEEKFHSRKVSNETRTILNDIPIKGKFVSNLLDREFIYHKFLDEPAIPLSCQEYEQLLKIHELSKVTDELGDLL